MFIYLIILRRNDNKCENLPQSRSSASPFEGSWSSVSYRMCTQPTPTLDLPDLTSGVWAAAPCSCFFTSTSIEALDDLNLRFGSRPRYGRFPSCCPCEPTMVAAAEPPSSISGGKTNLLPFLDRSLHLPPRRELFFSHWARTSFVTSTLGFLFPSSV